MVGGVGLAAADPELGDERLEPPADARRLELVGEHRRHGDGHPLGDLEHRHVRADDGVEQPLLAERVGAESLDVGHVGVKDDRQVARVPCGGAHVRQTATKSSARSRSQLAAGRQLEIGRGDRRHEAVVERLRDPQRLVDTVPSERERELVGAQLASVEEAVDLDLREMRLEQLPVLGGRVLAQVPRVLGLLRPRRREREPVRRRDVGDRGDLGEPGEQLAGLGDVLDRLQEDHRVAWLAVGLDEPTLEAQAVGRVAQPRVLVRLGVGVDPDDFGRAAREDGRAVALAAGEIDDA